MASLLASVLVGTGVIDLQRLITDYLPELSNSAYAGATMRDLLDMQIASGFCEDCLDTTGVLWPIAALRHGARSKKVTAMAVCVIF